MCTVFHMKHSFRGLLLPVRKVLYIEKSLNKNYMHENDIYMQ